MSHEERWKKILTLVDNAIVEALIELIKKDDILTIENFPSFTAQAHSYFSMCIHSYVQEQKKFYLHQFDELPDFIVGRKNAKKVIHILFQINGSLSVTPVSSPNESVEKK
jgi:hypothetical protein